MNYSDTNLTEGTTYYYRMRAVFDSFDSDHSNMSYAMTLPMAPTDLAVTFVNGGQVNLTWHDHSSIEVGYSIEQLIGSTWQQVQTTASGTGTMNASITGTFDPLIQYNFRVRAYEYDFNGDPLYSLPLSDTETAAAWPAAPTDLTATAASDTEIDLSWTDNTTDSSTGYNDRAKCGRNYGLDAADAHALVIH